jgi:1-acyl-sn-glycerol-3-phosphate acyltransferase
VAPPQPVTIDAPATDRQLDELTRLNANDLVTAFKLDRTGPLRGIVDTLAQVPARRFSRQIAEFDRLVGAQGLAAGGRYILNMFARSFEVAGAEHIPPSGPLLICSNHPGMADAMGLWVGLERRADLKIIAAERELLRSVPNTSRYLMYVAPATGGRTGLLRAAAAHLVSGGALLTFPAGHIEPDPSVRPGAAESLETWSSSTALLARLAPDAAILPAAVGGVISASAMRVPLLQLFKTQKERDWAAATLQVLIPGYRDVHTRVAFGPCLRAADLADTDPAAAIAALAERMRPLIAAVGIAAAPRAT